MLTFRRLVVLIPNEFDAIVCFDRTSHSAMLPFRYHYFGSAEWHHGNHLPPGSRVHLRGRTNLVRRAGNSASRPRAEARSLLARVPTKSGQYNFVLSISEGSARATAPAQITID